MVEVLSAGDGSRRVTTAVVVVDAGWSGTAVVVDGTVVGAIVVAGAAITWNENDPSMVWVSSERTTHERAYEPSNSGGSKVAMIRLSLR